MSIIIPDFWLAGRLIVAAANWTEVLDFVDVADLFEEALEGFEDLALLALEDWALLARLLSFEEGSEPEGSFSESLMLIYIKKMTDIMPIILFLYDMKECQDTMVKGGIINS